MEGERTARAIDERLAFSGPVSGTSVPAAAPAHLPAEVGPTATVASGRRISAIAQRAVAAAGAAFDIERQHGTGFVVTPALLVAGAVGYFCLPTEPPPAALAVLTAGMLAAVAVRGSGAARIIALSLLLIATGAGLAAVETWRHSTPMLGSAITTRITGRVVAIEDRGESRQRLTIDLFATERPKLRHAPDRFRATARDVPAGLLPGDGVAGVVRMLPATGPARPDGYDFAFENYFDGIGANGFFLSGPFRLDKADAGGPADALSAWVERLRTALAAHIRSRIGGPEGEIAAALVAGVRGGIPDEITAALRKTGLAHFLAISGLHMALVAGTVVGAVRYGFALFPSFSSRRPVKKYAAAAGLLALALYLIMSGAAVAAQRAFIMFAVMLVAVFFDRAALTLRNLAIAALIIIAIAPHEVMGPSFQMSFAATAALIGAYGWYTERRMRRPAAPVPARSLSGNAFRFVFLFMGGLAMTSLIAGLATGLFAAWHFQRVAPLGLIANLAAMPIVTVGVMPFAVAGVATMPFGIDGLFFGAMGKALGLVIAIATGLAERSPVDIVGALPAPAVAVLASALVIATLATTWLRAAAVPLVILGALLIMTRDQPDLLISEDARLVAMPLSNGNLAVNRSRPSAFTVEIWSAALRTRTVERPEDTTGIPKAGENEQAFQCGEGLCLARHASGAVVAHAANAQSAEPACGVAMLIVIDDATAANSCGRGVTITKRDLALRGSAAVRFGDAGTAIRHAIGETLRPWHDHRGFSREARGMAPYKRKREDNRAEGPVPTTTSPVIGSSRTPLHPKTANAGR